ncbi:type I secretion system permease/ATPase [Fuscibacter oryzae]|uniref:type I secretion system permease/ATPase n=1 Tax=Fuscibacter oryzae TaxID=2803939 RepID=UPI002E2A5C4C|nr:type I secretion system permease/ATPase [Fuscibacter oryzae]
MQWGRTELRVEPTGLLVLVGLFSVAVNLLLLTGPVYMLQVYDRVLTSRSQPTLVALSVLAAGLFAAMGLVEHARGRILARLGAALQSRIEARVLSAAQTRLARQPEDAAARIALQDLDAVQRLWTSPVMAHVFDLPWCPLFLAILFAFGAPLGWLALAGAMVLWGLAVLTRSATSAASNSANLNHLRAEAQVAEMLRQAEGLRGLGMTGPASLRWKDRRRAALTALMRAADRAAAIAALSRILRMVLQSAMLGLGALLVLEGALSAGAMVAGSVLLGRSLQPVEQVIAHWHLIIRGQEAYRRLSALLASTPPAQDRSPLPRPAPRLEVQGLTIVPPGGDTPVLRSVTFRLEPGQSLGVLGPSGAGKSSLARALAGAWPAAAGTVRLDGATPDQFGPDGYGRLIGYVPQRLHLFEGTVADNIARLDLVPAPGAIISAAHRAGAHDMILRLPLGYDTPVSAQGGPLSGGQTQLIGLARALYGDPVVLVLDEPHANLDAAGQQALEEALLTHRAGGGIVILFAHQVAQVQGCDLLMMLDQGRVHALGPREAVLQQTLRPALPGLRAIAPGAGA